MPNSHVPRPDPFLSALGLSSNPSHRSTAVDAALVHTYATQHAGDLHRVWETERPFELHLAGVIIHDGDFNLARTLR